METTKEITMKEWAKKVAERPLNDISDRFAVYGSLRKGKYNYDRLLKPLEQNDGLEFEGHHVMKGFKMYSLGYYPFIVKTDNENDEVVAELYHVKNKAACVAIHMMEIGAGYGVEEVSVNEKSYYTYVFSNERGYEGRLDAVPEGDWVKHGGKKS